MLVTHLPGAGARAEPSHRIALFHAHHKSYRRGSISQINPERVSVSGVEIVRGHVEDPLLAVPTEGNVGNISNSIFVDYCNCAANSAQHRYRTSGCAGEHYRGIRDGSARSVANSELHRDRAATFPVVDA